MVHLLHPWKPTLGVRPDSITIESVSNQAGLAQQIPQQLF